MFSLRVLPPRRRVHARARRRTTACSSRHASDFTWRDGLLRRPDPADRRRAADDRRRVPPARARGSCCPPSTASGSRRRSTRCIEEIERASTRGGPATRRLYAWARHLALRVAMRALFGLDPDRRPAGSTPRASSSAALAFYGREYWLQVLRGPGTPWAALSRVAPPPRRADPRARSRAAGAAGDAGEDLLSLLLDAADEDGGAAHRRARARPGDDAAVRRPRHDHLDRRVPVLRARPRPDVAERLAAERDARRRRRPDGRQLFGELPQLDLAVDETLRLYPPAWVGPRRAVRTFAFAGERCPAARPSTTPPTPATGCRTSWTTRTRSGRSASRPRSARLPKGAYVPFGGGSRRASACASASSRSRRSRRGSCASYRLELRPGTDAEIRQTPTLGPRRADCRCACAPPELGVCHPHGAHPRRAAPAALPRRRDGIGSGELGRRSRPRGRDPARPHRTTRADGGRRQARRRPGRGAGPSAARRRARRDRRLGEAARREGLGRPPAEGAQAAAGARRRAARRARRARRRSGASC